jgi:hypothetical protein
MMDKTLFYSVLTAAAHLQIIKKRMEQMRRKSRRERKDDERGAEKHE